jgi:hypothetical protein
MKNIQNKTVQEDVGVAVNNRWYAQEGSLKLMHSPELQRGTM